jgi:hypothetical protein
MLTWFVQRWTLEVTFEEAQAHLGMETQRQWNDRAIALVRQQLWEHIYFSTSLQETDMIKMPRELFERFMDAVCYAA